MKLNYYTNLYQGTLQLGSLGNTHYSLKITEQEYLKLITQAMKEFAKISDTKLNTYLTAHAHPLSSDANNYNSTTTNSARFAQANIISWLQNVKARAKNMVEYNNGKRVEYSFGETFVDKSGVAKDTPLTKQEITDFFDLAAVLSYNAWTAHDDFKACLADDFKETADLVVLPAHTEPIAESKLKEWGIEGYKVDLATKKTNYYTTNYGTVIITEN